MESSNKNQSVEGEKIYKTKLRDQYLIDHKEEILKLNHIGRVKKVQEMFKQDLNLDVNFNTLRGLINKYVIRGITIQNTKPRKLRDQYLIDHKEEILKYDDKDRVKKVAEQLKQNLNLDVKYNTLYPLLNKYVITDITNQNKESRKLRDKYLLDHKEEILKLDHKCRIKKVQEMLKRDLNLDVNYNKMYVAFNKYHLL